ncbi:zf-HC2 domain-containing protein [Streptomyces sannanensis]|uniref:Zf-HC2 domain-containing protein n=1 Tax=Streptomyces sannanensis TaxID=285536 RepID=A0ABP6SFB7_9ACTN
MSSTGPTPAEQHLGDRLAALVDGELSHDHRERVLSHLATCPKCKAEADAQRRLKNVFAQSAPPAPSEGLLARLQGLPAGPGGDDDGTGGPFGGGRLTGGVFPVSSVLPDGSADRGFRIHEVGRPDTERSGRRGRRFAFAAASAVSFAAIALGASLPVNGPVEIAAKGKGAPMRAGAGTSSVPSAGTGTESNRRRGSTSVPVTGLGDRTAPAVPAVSPAPSPSYGVLAAAGTVQGPQLVRPYSASLLTPSVTPSLVRPVGVAPSERVSLSRPSSQQLPPMR